MSTSVPLLQASVPSNPESITTTDVQNNHQILMANNKPVNIDAIINILGGADFVLQHFLSTQNAALTKEQLNQINNTLLTQINVSNLTESLEFEIPTPTLKVSAENTFLHKYCHKQTVNKIINTILSKYTSAIFVILMIITLIMDIHKFKVNTYWSIFFLIGYLYCGPFLILQILSLNKTTTKYILKSFEFWFKLFYYIRHWIASIMINGFSLANTGLLLFLGTIIYGLLDGLQLPLRYKGTCLVIGAVLFTWIGIRWTFFMDHEEYIYTLNGWEIDLVSMGASSIRIVALFAWKQTIYSIVYPLTSTLILKQVRILWK